MRIELPAGFLPGPVLRYHGRDPSGPTERVAGLELRKAILIGGAPHVLAIRLEGRSAALTCDPAPGDAERGSVQAIARRLLGLHDEPPGLARLARHDRHVARLVRARPGLRIPLTATPFEALVWAILGQQINLAFAGTLRRRVIAACGRPHPSGMIAHPTPGAVAGLGGRDLIALQVSTAKARYLLESAAAVASGTLPLDSLGSLPQADAETKLLALRGIGPWTANYVLLRGLGFPDCVPLGDSGLATALRRFYALDRRPTIAETRDLMAPFAPFRSLATCHFWVSLDDEAT
ncbi:MAG: DNA-3-methyladenine glycosylase 2 family protein [Alphaproteobacteria bacterium]|nr:DNA-3-methyladenine glycosylase 2 family protein [Alphaproteobacteria bacterium]